MSDRMIHNPILPGCNPDPNIFTDGRRYYIAVSTFTWVPGVRVYVSDDLVDWRYETSVLATPALADFAGRPDNMAVWAPMMTWHDGVYYLIYTDVSTTQRPFADASNYIVTATDIHGPWSEPVYINGSGFDPSIFFDDDGSMYVVNELWDYRRATHNKSDGIVLQRLDPTSFQPMGEPRRIFDGTEAAKTEAPHIYRHNGRYYLMTAEGGTGTGHQVTVARSRSVWGPYEVDPATPMLTSKDRPDWPLQCAGHGSIVKTLGGEWYMAHLCTRPIDGHAVLGREAALQRVEWTGDGWLRLAHGGHLPAMDVPAPSVIRRPSPVILSEARRVSSPVILSKGRQAGVEGSLTSLHPSAFLDPFTAPFLDPARWNTVRELPGDWLSTGPDGLTIMPGASPQSPIGQHMVATRQTDFSFRATASLRYEPRTYLDMAGMLLYLDARRYLFLAITRDERLDGQGGPVIARLMENRDGTFAILGDAALAGGDEGTACELAVTVNRATADFAVNGRTVATGVDVTFLSGGFTGDFIGLTNVGMNRRMGPGACPARFERFEYRPLD